MAEPKKAASKRIIDVEHADKTPTAATSKPVLVTNRPILQDPMMVDDTDQEEAPVPKNSSGNTIQPLSAPELPGAKSEPKKSETPTPKIEKTKTLAELDADSKAKDTEVTEDAKEDNPSEQEPLSDNTSDDTPETEKTDQNLIEDESEKQAAKDAELQKLVDSKQYFLPINSVEKRRSKHVVVGGVLLSLVLIAAWVNIALDAGLIKADGVPHTHYFDQSTAVATTDTAVTPVEKTKLYTTSVSGMNFKYPAGWQLTNQEISPTSDNIIITPTQEDDSRTGSVFMTFTSPIADKDSRTSTRSINYVAHQKLPSKVSSSLYLRDIVFETYPGKFQAGSSLTNDNFLKPQNSISKYDNFFTTSSGTKISFSIIAIKGEGTRIGFDSVEDAKKFIKTPDFQKARKILISLAPVKS